jgi:hypothetical protein
MHSVIVGFRDQNSPVNAGSLGGGLMSPSLGPQMGYRSPDQPTLLRRAAHDISRGTAKIRIAGSGAHGSTLAP